LSVKKNICCVVDAIKKFRRERKFQKEVAIFIDERALEEEAEEKVEYFVFGVLKRRKSEKKGFG
jgi:hypothetical protein